MFPGKGNYMLLHKHTIGCISQLLCNEYERAKKKNLKL